jgi:hypothetical protein
MNNITVHDNFLSNDYFEYLQKLFLSKGHDFQWTYGDGVVYDHDEKDFQFFHIIYNNNTPASPYFNELGGVFELLNPLSIIRIKANLLTRTSEQFEHGMHVDIPNCDCNNLRTAIFYMNTNNGYTHFECGKKVNSVENRMVIFPTQMKHTGSTCTDEKVRVIINFNYLSWY